MKIMNRKDFDAGVMFTVCGFAFAFASSKYEIGVASSMGPGYFPLIIGSLLVMMGGIITVRSIVSKDTSHDEHMGIEWKPLLLVTGATVLFGALLTGAPKFGIPRVGLIGASFSIVFLSSLAGDRFRAKEAAILAAILAAVSYLIFSALLGLPLPLWPHFDFSSK